MHQDEICLFAVRESLLSGSSFTCAGLSPAPHLILNVSFNSRGSRIKIWGLLHSTGEATAVVPMIWLSPITVFCLCTFQLGCRRQQSAGHWQNGCRGVECSSPACAEVPPGMGLQGWPWVKPNHVSIPWSSLSPCHAKTEYELQGPSDPQEMLGASLLFYSWDHKHFLAPHPNSKLLSPTSGNNEDKVTNQPEKIQPSPFPICEHPCILIMHFNHAFWDKLCAVVLKEGVFLSIGMM